MRPANTIQVGLKDHSMMLVDCEGHQLKELSEYFSFLSTCPNCGSRFVARNDFILLIYGFFRKIIQKG